MATAVAPRLFKNFINGEWVESRSGRAYENRNPAKTGELIGMFVSSTHEDVDVAVAAATEAYKAWRLVPAPKRAEILFRAAELLLQRKEEFSKDMTREMGKVLTEAGVPRGVVNLVSGDGPGAGAPLSQHKDVPVISFTGSTAVGRMIAEACAPQFKHYSLEMGGKNIIMVMDDANLDLAVDGAVWGGFGTAGERCPADSRGAALASVYKGFVERFVVRVE